MDFSQPPKDFKIIEKGDGTFRYKASFTCPLCQQKIEKKFWYGGTGKVFYLCKSCSLKNKPKMSEEVLKKRGQTHRKTNQERIFKELQSKIALLNLDFGALEAAELEKLNLTEGKFKLQGGKKYFYCLNCGDPSIKSVRRNLSSVKDNLLCKKCNSHIARIQKYGSSRNFFDSFREKKKQTVQIRYNEVLPGHIKLEKLKKDPEWREKTDKAKVQGWNKKRIQLVKEKFDGSEELQAKCKIENGFVVCLACGSRRKIEDSKKYGSGLRHLFMCSCWHKSAQEEALAQFLASLGLNLERNRRDIISKEIDIYLPEKKVGIEFDGVFWHANGKKDQILKTQECERQGIRLIHIWENEWVNNKGLVKSTLKHLLGISDVQKIPARKCRVKEIDSNLYTSFCQINHLQGVGKAKVKLGLFYQDTLVQVMSFGLSRFNSSYEWEIIRECSLQNTQVIGGKSKLFQYFIKEFKPKSVISYCDRRWFLGDSYLKLGMTFIGFSEPTYYYTRSGHTDLHHRVEFQKHKLKEKLKKFDESLTEKENMTLNGYRRIYDCGQRVYGWKA